MDLAWNKDEVVLLAFEFKSSAKVARLHVFNENFRPTKSCVLRTKENPRTLNILRPNLATVGYTFIGIVEFWDVQTLSCLYVLRAHSASINTVLFNENSTQMYTASENRAIKVWNLEKIPQISEKSGYDVTTSETRDVFRQLTNHEAFATKVQQLKVMASGNEVMMSYSDKPPTILNLAKNLERKSLESSSDSGTENDICLIFPHKISERFRISKFPLYRNRMKNCNVV